MSERTSMNSSISCICGHPHPVRSSNCWDWIDGGRCRCTSFHPNPFPHFHLFRRSPQR